VCPEPGRALSENGGDMKNLYEVLGVTPDADENRIKKAYRELAKRYRPDANPGNKEAARRFQEITQAYEVLGEAKKREKYDREQTETKQEKRNSQPHEKRDFDINDLAGDFEDFFGFHPTSGEVDEEKMKMSGKKEDESAGCFGFV